MASYNSDNSNNQQTINWLANILNSAKSELTNVQANYPLLLPSNGVGLYPDPRLQMLLYQMSLQPTQKQEMQNHILKLLTNPQIPPSMYPFIGNPYYQSPINPICIGNISQINNYNLNLPNAAQVLLSYCKANSLRNELFNGKSQVIQFNKKLDESEKSLKDKENEILIKDKCEPGQIRKNEKKEQIKKKDKTFCKKKRSREAKCKNFQKNKQCSQDKIESTSDGNTESADLTQNKKERKKKRNYLSRANELLQDSFLAVMDKNNKVKTIPPLEPEEIPIKSASEDPKGFLKRHFPVVYPYVRREEEKYHIPKEKLINASQVFLHFPNENLEVFTCSNTHKKVWTPLDYPEVDLSDFLFKIEQIWPTNSIPFSIEFSLEFLMINKYNFDKVENLVKFRDKSFKNFLNNKKMSAAEVDKISSQYKESYLLRKKADNDS